MTKSILFLLLILVTLAIPAGARQVHATGPAGVVYVSPQAIDPAQYSVGSIFSVTVQVSGLASFNGWGVSVQTDPSVILPMRVNFTGDLFEANYSITPVLQSDCVNGSGTGCSQSDGLGIATSAAQYPVGVPPPNLGANESINGTLFKIIYSVKSVSGFSRIDFAQDILIHAVNGVVTPIPNTPLPGSYGTDLVDFRVSANPGSLVVHQGSNVSTTITVFSINGFSGSVNLTSSKELQAIFDKQTLSLQSNGIATTKLTLLTSGTTQVQVYPRFAITASNATLSRSFFLSVNVEGPPDFLLDISPSLLRIHAGDSANTTITVASQNEFSGSVNLVVQVPVNVSFVLSSSILILEANMTSTASLSVSTPIVSLPFFYKINATASSSLATSKGTLQLSHERELDVRPPSPSFLVIVDPKTITVRAGLTSGVTITVRSIDYFWGFVYLAAIMSGGAASFDINTYYVPLPDSIYSNVTESANFTLTVYVPIDQVPGHYIVLVTVYQNLLTQTIGIPVVITSLYPFHSASNPSILGLSPLVYFGILGVLVIPFIALSVYTYRKTREEEDEDWKA